MLCEVRLFSGFMTDMCIEEKSKGWHTISDGTTSERVFYENRNQQLQFIRRSFGNLEKENAGAGFPGTAATAENCN